MNCKPGDLAIVVKTLEGKQVGMIVLCVRHVTKRTVNFDGPIDAWETSPMLVHRGAPVTCPDEWLRPIRPGDVTDEEVRELYAPKQPEVA